MAKVSLRAYNREIEAMIDRGQLDEAVAHCQHILKTFPKHLETYRLLGKAYLELKRHNDAIDIFSRTLNAEPSDFVAHVGLSLVRDEQGKLDDAIWHMERALETQPSNAAVQGELQRLYGRRDGVQPPRIRMTRGALAHMYVQGELYPQAISEIKGVLQEDPGRSDMQALLATAYYRSGQKNAAADAASSLLKRYPYCFDANRVLVEILGTEHPEGAQMYRRRVAELDPYAAQVSGTVFQSQDVSDAAVMLERLDWNGQPTRMEQDWGTTQAIALDSGKAREEQPEWLKSGGFEETPPSAPTLVPAFTDSTPTQPPAAPAKPEEDIPDFLRDAGWGPSSGEFDESKATFAGEAESPSGAQPIEKGEMPEWLKAMAPPEGAEPVKEEALPDWIEKIGTDELRAPSEETDWMSQLGATEQERASDGDSDWLEEFGQQEEQPAAPSEEQPDWLKDLGEEPSPEPASTLEPDWMAQLQENREPAEPEQPSSEFDFLEEFKGEPEQTPAPEVPASPKVDTGELGASEKEQDDAFAWLESLAAKQGASEGLLTKPEERLEDEPEWIKQAKSLTQPPAPAAEVPVSTPPAAPPPAKVEDLGRSEQERDDSFAWLEGLAAKQGATEGLLTRPEERSEEEPEWVKQSRDVGAEQPAAAQPEPETLSTAEETEAWLRSLDEEEEETPEAAPADDTALWIKALDAQDEAPAEQAQEVQDEGLPAWMKDIDKEKAPETEPAIPETEAQELSASGTEELPEWLSDLDKEEKQAVTSSAADLPPWMRDETGELVAEPPKIEPTRKSDWKPVEAKEEEPVETPPPAPQPEPAKQPEPEPTPAPPPAPKEKKAAAPRPKKEVKPATPSGPYQEPVTIRGTGMLTMPVDPILASARNELSRSNIPGALEAYGKLIKKGRFLDEVIYDLREALYRYPVEVSIWQSLGDAYMRANRLQDALDAYTKAEELLR